MDDKFTRLSFEKVFNVEKIITLFYMELSKNFRYEGEQHDFWEMVYIDRGEMICTADKNRFILKSGEMIFHKPNEFHNHMGNDADPPNISIVTFECCSWTMQYFDGTIFRLDGEEKTRQSMLFSEGMSCYRLADETSPLLPTLERISDAPFGASQMTKNLLEVFLIRLYRHADVVSRKVRMTHVIDGVDIPQNVKEIIDLLQANVYGNLTVADIAAAVGKSESTVKQLFARFHKNGIIRYYNSLKIKEAKRLIREGSCNFTQIAEMLHFDTPQYFSKCFKAFTGRTPSQYKASILK